MNNREETYIHILLGMMTDDSDLRTSHAVTLCPLFLIRLSYSDYSSYKQDRQQQ